MEVNTDFKFSSSKVCLNFEIIKFQNLKLPHLSFQSILDIICKTEVVKNHIITSKKRNISIPYFNYLDTNNLQDECYFLKSNGFSWSDNEQKLFIKEFLANIKEFHRISSVLPFRSTKNCVRFYYLNKKRLHLKRRISEKIYS